jgi:hypothetical protein
LTNQKRKAEDVFENLQVNYKFRMKQTGLAFLWLWLLAMTPFVAGDASTALIPATAANTLSLSGAGFIEIANAPALNPSGGLTVEAWVRRADASADCQTIVGKGYQTGFWLGVCDNRLRFYSNGAGSAFDGATPFVAGEWTHVAAVFDGTTRRLYINGHLDVESVRASALPVNDQPLRIGADVGDAFSTYRFIGNLAEVRLWRSARSRDDTRRDLRV